MNILFDFQTILNYQELFKVLDKGKFHLENDHFLQPKNLSGKKDLHKKIQKI